MLQEMKLEDALEKFLQGKKVLVAPDKVMEPGKERYLFRSLGAVLNGKRFLVEVPAVENLDFKEAVEQMVVSEKLPAKETFEQLEDPEEDQEDNKVQAQEPRGYTGFLHIRCGHCGKTKTFCSKHRLNYYQCKECGKRIDLKDLKLAFINCECGNWARYFTNETAEMFDLECIDCGMPVALKYNAKKNLYETIRS